MSTDKPSTHHQVHLLTNKILTQTSYMKKRLTNIEAINQVSSMSDRESKPSVVASIFAKEDIIEHDVDNWVLIPTHELLHQFKGYAVEAASGYIDEAERNNGHLRFKEEMFELHNRNMELLDSAIEYSRIHSAVKEQSER